MTSQLKEDYYENMVEDLKSKMLDNGTVQLRECPPLILPRKKKSYFRRSTK